MGKFYSTFEAAKICHVSPGSMIRWIHEGKLNASVTAGGHHRISGKDLLNLIKAMRLPIPQDLKDGPEVERGKSSPANRESGKILVADDEPGIRDRPSMEWRSLLSLYESSSKAIHSTVNLKELLEIVMELIQKILGADEGSIMLLDEENKLHVAASRGIDEAVARNVHLAVGERVAGRAAQLRLASSRNIASSPRISASRLARDQPWICFSHPKASSMRWNSADHTSTTGRRRRVYAAPSPPLCWLTRSSRFQVLPT